MRNSSVYGRHRLRRRANCDRGHQRSVLSALGPTPRAGATRLSLTVGNTGTACHDWSSVTSGRLISVDQRRGDREAARVVIAGLHKRALAGDERVRATMGSRRRPAPGGNVDLRERIALLVRDAEPTSTALQRDDVIVVQGEQVVERAITDGSARPAASSTDRSVGRDRPAPDARRRAGTSRHERRGERGGGDRDEIRR